MVEEIRDDDAKIEGIWLSDIATTAAKSAAAATASSFAATTGATHYISAAGSASAAPTAAGYLFVKRLSKSKRLAKA